MSKASAPKGKIQKTANGAAFQMDPAEINKAKASGRIYSGAGDVLTMEAGQTTGPWKVTEVRRDQKLDPRYGAVDVVVAEHSNGRTMRMPAATSFRDKAKLAGLDVGYVFAVTREDDYTANGKECQGYSIIVISSPEAKTAKKK